MDRPQYMNALLNAQKYRFDPSAVRRTQALVEFAEVATERAQLILSAETARSGRDLSDIEPPEGGLIDENGVLLELLNDGWGGSAWAEFAENRSPEILDLEQSLVDVAHATWRVHPRSAVAELATTVLEARRHEFADALGAATGARGLGALIESGLVDPRWTPSRRFHESVAAEDDVDARDGRADALRRSPERLLDRAPDARLGIAELAEEIVNWRFCHGESARYWHQRNRLLAVSLGLGLDHFTDAITRLMLKVFPEHYPHPREAIGAGLSENGWLEIPVSLTDPDLEQSQSDPIEQDLASLRLHMIDFVASLLSRATANNVQRTVRLTDLWELGLPKERPQPWFPPVDMDEF